MKIKITLILAVAVLGMTYSCKKEGCNDPTALNYDEKAKKDDGSCEYGTLPTITLTGDATITLEIGATYTEEGATAVSYDGSSVTVEIDDSNLDVNAVGSYTIVYSATNNIGIATSERTVNVIMTAAALYGDYTMNTDCSGTAFPLSDPAEMTGGGAINEVFIPDAFEIIEGDIIGVVDGLTVTIPSATVAVEVFGVPAGEIVYSGTGVINAAGTEVVITFTYDNTAPLVGGNGTCTATYTKQ